MKTISQIPDIWKVQVSFPSAAEAAEFKKRLEKVKEEGSRPLYNALLASAMRNMGDIVIVKGKVDL